MSFSEIAQAVVAPLAPSLLMVIGGVISWVLKSRREELQELDRQLSSKRERIYLEALRPYITMFTDKKDGMRKGLESARAIIKSEKYWKNQIELCLYAPDNVVKAFNNLLEYTYSSEETDERSGYVSLGKYAKLLLEVRKALGNKRTRIEPLDMLIGSIKDAREQRKLMNL